MLESLGQNALQRIITVPQQPLAPGGARIRLMRAHPLRVGRPNPMDLIVGVIGVDSDVSGHEAASIFFGPYPANAAIWPFCMSMASVR